MRTSLLRAAAWPLLLLAPVGLVAAIEPVKAQTADPAVNLGLISVTAPPLTPDQRLQAEGQASNGYRPETISSVGPLGSKPLQDTPYSISVVPQALIQNLQATSPQSVFDANPLLQTTLPESAGVTTRLISRGFTVDSAEDGMRFLTFNFGPIPIEDKERIEVLSGLSGLLYGSTDPGGMVNYVLKRPTAAPMMDVTTGYYGGSAYVHGDFGGPITPDGRLGYRLNIVGQDGPQPVQDQNVQRGLISAALDWHVTDSLLLQIDGSHQDYVLNGPAAAWNLTGLNIAAPDASRDWSEPFTRASFSDNNAGVRLQWSPNNTISVRAAYKYMWNRVDTEGAQNLAISKTGAYSQFVNKLSDNVDSNQAAYLLGDIKFDTSFIRHKVTFGVFGNQDYGSVPLDNNPNKTVPGFNAFAPGFDGPAQEAAALAEAHLVTGALRNAVFIRNDNYNAIAGDEVQFTDQISAIVGATYADIKQKNYSADALTSAYGQDKITPSVSLIYKPVPAVSTYATYIQGLESGGIAGLTQNGLPVTNPGAAAPTVDEQYEVGVKTTVGNMLLTAALFDITKASEVFQPNAAGTAVTFSNSGREEHRGGEVTAIGKLTPGLTVYGGVTGFQARINSQPATPALVGKQPVGVSTFMAKLYAEYGIGAIPGLTLTGGFQYYNRQSIDNLNTSSIPGYVVGNLGARFERTISGRPAILRLDVVNVAGANYWMSSTSGGAFEGVPRTFLASAEVKF